MAFDIVEKRWLKEFLDPLGIPAGFFSEAVPSSKVAGFLKEDAASQLGLPADLPVVTGAHDQCCSAIGMGIMDSDLAGDGTGSMEALLRMTGNPSLSIAAGEKGISCQCHAISGKYLLLSFQLTAGSLIRWYRDQLGGLEKLAAAQSDADAYDIITGGAAKSSPGAGGLLLLPHFLGSGTGRVPPLDARSRGALLGLSLTHTRQDIARAMFEGITYETRFLLEGLEEGGERIDALVVTGGAAKSPFWLQLKADITGKRILVPQITEASCLGAAVLAGIGTGLYCSWDEAITKACHIRETNVPDSKARSIYDRQYSIYKGIYCTLLSLHSQLVDASLNGQE
jgi:xylulokinase